MYNKIVQPLSAGIQKYSVLSEKQAMHLNTIKYPSENFINSLPNCWFSFAPPLYKGFWNCFFQSLRANLQEVVGVGAWRRTSRLCKVGEMSQKIVFLLHELGILIKCFRRRFYNIKFIQFNALSKKNASKDNFNI